MHLAQTSKTHFYSISLILSTVPGFSRSGLRDRFLDLIGSDLELETHEKEFFIIGCHASRVKAILYESGLLRGRENLEESLISLFLLLVSCFLPLPILTALSTLRIFETGGPPLSFT